MGSSGNADWTAFDRVRDEAAMDRMYDEADRVDRAAELTPEERAEVRRPRRAFRPRGRRRVLVDPRDFEVGG
jgi:hypothetical protein